MECALVPEETTLHGSLLLEDEAEPATVVSGSSLPEASWSPRDASSDKCGMSPSREAPVARRKIKLGLPSARANKQIREH